MSRNGRVQMAEAPTPFPPSSSSSSNDRRQRMLHRVISSGLTIKSQQRGEPDPSEKEKMDILSGILHTQPGAFLMRFGKVLDEVDLRYFDGHSDYEVVFRVKELRKHLNPKNRQKRVQNRRFECMKELMDTDYFSEEEMRQRNPLLFNYYIGQYLSEEELAALDSTTSDMTLSSHIMRKMQLDKRREKLKWQTEREREQLEEEDTSSEEEMEGTAAEVTEDEKWRLRKEFLRAMQLSFLRGEDKAFDYSQVDANERYDSIETQQQDTEDAYFDEEEPQWCHDHRTDIVAGTSGEEPGRVQR